MNAHNVLPNQLGRLLTRKLVGSPGQEIYTEGVATCVAVALVYKERGFLFHEAGPQHADTFDKFLRTVCREIPQKDRRTTVVVLAGAHAEGRAQQKEADESKRYCTTRLQEECFFSLHSHWLTTPYNCQNITVNPSKMTVQVDELLVLPDETSMISPRRVRVLLTPLNP